MGKKKDKDKGTDKPVKAQPAPQTMPLRDLRLKPDASVVGAAVFADALIPTEDASGATVQVAASVCIHEVPLVHPSAITGGPNWLRWLARYAYERPAAELRAADFPDTVLNNLLVALRLRWPTEDPNLINPETGKVMVTGPLAGLLALVAWAAAREGQSRIVIPRALFDDLAVGLGLEVLFEQYQRMGVIHGYEARRLGGGGIAGRIGEFVGFVRTQRAG